MLFVGVLLLLLAQGAHGSSAAGGFMFIAGSLLVGRVALTPGCHSIVYVGHDGCHQLMFVIIRHARVALTPGCHSSGYSY
jgi:hypothetical protein